MMQPLHLTPGFQPLEIFYHTFDTHLATSYPPVINFKALYVVEVPGASKAEGKKPSSIVQTRTEVHRHKHSGRSVEELILSSIELQEKRLSTVRGLDTSFLDYA